MTGVLIRNCEVDGEPALDVRVRNGDIVEIAAGVHPDSNEELIEASGGALIPGLHDHHLHLFALAAALESVDCSPSMVGDRRGFADALRAASVHGPVRAVGYFESVAGSLDRDALDALAGEVPVRVQHRSGSVWFLNSAALTEYGLIDSSDPAVDRDANGRAIGRLTRGDHLLQRADSALPNLNDVSRLLASYGVSGVTDATPRLDVRSVLAVHDAQDDGALLQRTLLLGAPLEAERAAGVPWKILVDEMQGLDPAGLVAEVRAAHAADRPAALHCTSRVECVLAVNALLEAGTRAGDRLEHAGVLPRELDAELVRAHVTVVTQPHFISERGDDYLANVDADDHGLLYRCGSLIDAGVRVAAGTDAPFGEADPWAAIAAAVSRRTRSGEVIGPRERITPSRALALFHGRGLDPGGSPRRVEVGAAADLCLLRAPLDEALQGPSADVVTATIIQGQVIYRH